MEAETLAAVIQAGATVVAAVVAAWILFVQIGRQAKHAIAQSKHSEGLKLKLDIYRQITGICGAHEDASGNLAGKIRWLQDEAADLLDPDHPLGFPRRQGVTWSELSSFWAEAQRTAIAVVTLIEQWQIVEPRLDLFKLAMNVALHDVREAAHTFMLKARILPPAHADGGHWSPPLRELSELWAECDAVLATLMKLDSWVSDFQLEMQSRLVGELFERTIQPRQPLDPSMYAIRLDQYGELKRRLENETEWGRKAEDTKRRVMDELKERQARLSATS